MSSLASIMANNFLQLRRIFCHFLQVSAAHTVLSDRVLRNQYDVELREREMSLARDEPKDCPIGQQPMGWMRVLRQGAWSWLLVYVTRSKEIEMEPGDGTGNLSFPVRTPLTQDSWGTSKRIVKYGLQRGVPGRARGLPGEAMGMYH